MRLILKTLLRIFHRVRISGDCAPLAAGGVLVLANHDSLLDGVILGLFLPRRPVVILSPEDVQRRRYRFLTRFFAHRVVDLSEPATVKTLVRLLAAG